jgi:hypothetical protein
MSDLAEKLSALVQYQLPDFVRANYDTFQAFLVAYYEFTEQNTEVQYAIQKSESYKDIDETIDLFVDNFLTQYAYDLPKSAFLEQQFKTALTTNSVESKRAFIKKAVNYYGAKGSEAGIRLLFRLLFNDEVTIYYPKEDILRPSEGTWKQRQSIKVVNYGANTSYSETIGGTVTGDVSGAFGVVDDVFTLGFSLAEPTKRVHEIQFENGSLNGTFLANELVNFEIGNLTTGNSEVIANGNVLSLVSSLMIDDGGIGYNAGELITGNNGFIASIVGVSDIGKIKSVGVNNFGFEQSQNTLTISLPNTNSNIFGQYEVSSNVATVVLFDTSGNSLTHGLTTGDTINVTFSTGMTGVNGFANVKSVISSRKFTLGNANVFYTSSGNLYVETQSANIVGIVGTVANYSGVYTDTKGHLSDNKKIQDSNFYQDYSYVIRAKQSSQYWRDIIKQVLHPAGLKLFSEVFVAIQAGGVGSVSVRPTVPVYQTLLRFLKLISSAALQPVRPSQEIVIESVSRVSRGLGRWRNASSTYQTLDQFKFDYDNLRIYDVGDLTVDFIAANANNPMSFAPPNEITQEPV